MASNTIPMPDNSVRVIARNKNLKGWLPRVIEQLINLHEVNPNCIPRVEGYIGGTLMQSIRDRAETHNNVVIEYRKKG